MSHSQEIENLFHADNVENIDLNIEEIELEIETITEEDYKFFEHYFYLFTYFLLPPTSSSFHPFS